jgi:hypothetical protein
MATVQVAVVNRALRLLGKLAAGASPTSDESSDCLTALNAMQDSWRTEGLMCYALREESLTLANADSSYTIGPTDGDLTTTRPIAIHAAWIVEDDQSYPVKMITDFEYAAITDKTTTADWPSRANYKASMPKGTLVVWPVPNATRTMKLLTQVPLSALALSDTLSVPPGWEDALASNLALAMAPEFELEPSALVVKMARESKANIKRVNMRPLRYYSEVAQLVGSKTSGNILSGEP